MKLKLILLVVLVAFAGSAKAQDPWPQERPDQREQSVINEDGGRSFIIKPASAPLHGVVKPGNATVDPQQHSIFLGSHWAEPAQRAREAQLSSLLANIRDHAQMDELTQSGIKNLFGATTSQEKLDVPSDRNINDLEIQSVLTAMLKEGSLPRPDAGAIYVVFLDPGLHSTLGPLVAGKHYLAYHGFFNASGGRIHYAVVSFQADSQGAYQIALRALVVAALNPTGSSSN